MIFLRHPRPDVDAGICYGHLDLDLAPSGPAEIDAAITQMLALEEQPELIISSPLKRAHKLAQAIAQALQLPLQTDPRLIEYGFGAWEGKRWSDLPRTDTESWMQDLWRNRAPGGDSFEELHCRVKDALLSQPLNAAFICHAGPIRAARMLVENMSFDEVFAWQVPYADVIDLREETRKWRMLR